jgi:hypothetical protein
MHERDNKNEVSHEIFRDDINFGRQNERILLLL